MNEQDAFVEHCTRIVLAAVAFVDAAPEPIDQWLAAYDELIDAVRAFQADTRARLQGEP